MSILYLATLIGVALAVLFVVAESIRDVTRKPRWHVSRVRLEVVQGLQRRHQNLPFVGADRREVVAKDVEVDRQAA